MRDDFMAFGQQSCSMVILGPKWSNTKFLFLHRSWDIWSVLLSCDE